MTIVRSEAGLGKLALWPELAAAHLQHLAAVAEAQRPRRLLQPRGGDARDLRRHVGAQAHHALAHRVHQAESLARHRRAGAGQQRLLKSEEHTSELQSLMRISYAVFCLK